MSAHILHRSILVATAKKPERFEKAVSFGADITLIDLEDSVPLEFKNRARRDGLEFLCKKRDIRRAFAVRPNKIDLEEGIRDALALIECDANPDVLILPKVESAEDVVIVDRLLSDKLKTVQYYATIETAKGVMNVCEIAKSSPRLTALVLGSADLADDIGSSMSWECMLFARQRIVMATSYAGIDAIDTPFFNFSDPEGLVAEAERAREMGFSGKIAIHPNQIETINHVFSPDPETIAWAKLVLDTRNNTTDGICVVNGKMVGPPMVNAAKRTLEIARRNNLCGQ